MKGCRGGYNGEERNRKGETLLEGKVPGIICLNNERMAE